MRSLSARTLREMEQLAGLEYAVARGDLTNSQALAEARAQGLPEKQLDVFLPGVARRVVRPTMRQVEPITHARAVELCLDFSEKLGFPVRLDWEASTTRLEIDAERATELVVPGGVVRAPGITEDALGLMVSHEVGHRTLRTRDESRADYWAARHGLRMLWPSDDRTAFANRAIDAALTTLMFCGQGTNESLDASAPVPESVRIPLGGYPTLQDRYSLYRAGIDAAPMPKVVRERWR